MDTSYNEIPYLGRVHNQTHIEYIALAAKLFQLEYPAIENCRVLELGCGDGSNTLMMAYNLPKAQFVGIDGSTTQIATGKKAIEFAGLQNIELHAMDIMDIDASFGQFDYVICHGVFSWVPPAVREKILTICKERLTAHGIGYISYNAYPAWKQHEMLRDMMRFHALRMPEAKEQIAQARALVQFLGEHIPHQTDSYGQFIQSQVEFISGLTEEYLYHEYLETYNQPFWFHEFVRLLADNHLQYLGDINLSAMTNMNWPEETKNILNEISPSQYELEQYMDMLRCRRFRYSLCIHDSRTITRTIEPHVFQDVYISYKACPKWTHIEPTEELNEELDRLLTNHTDVDESTINQHSIYKTIFSVLHYAWPKRLHFQELIQIVEEETNQIISAQEKLDLAELLQTLYFQEVIRIHLCNPPLVNHISDKPKLSDISRYLATYQEIIATQNHDMVALKKTWILDLVQELDGTKTIAEITNIVWNKMETGEIPPERFPEGQDLSSTKKRELLESRIEESLYSFLENAALEA